MNLLCKALILISYYVIYPEWLNAQFGQLPPYSIEIEPIKNIHVPGLHSFSFAQSGSKWLFIGGRINGLHGLNSNDGFPVEHANGYVVVIDTNTWQSYSSDLSHLPKQVADPLRSTNMQYACSDNYLYMSGGYGWDSIVKKYVSFPVFSAINIEAMIDSVILGNSIGSTIKQVTDTNFAVCGGEMALVGNTFYQVFGHHFMGRYSDPPTPLFTQRYTHQIRKFSINNTGNTLTINGFTYETDTSNFHRRDLNVGPIILPGGEQALRAYSGVFRKDRNLPYLEPITIQGSGTTVHNDYKQVMSHYTCALMPVYNSGTQIMHTTFFGGISLNDYKPQSNTVVEDTLVPFISDVTTINCYPGNVFEETIMPIQLPGLIGSNAKFILNRNIAHFSNGVIDLNALPGSRVLAGYIFGGIRAQVPNNGVSTVNDTIYRVYLTRNTTNIAGNLKAENQLGALIYPNPANNKVTLTFHLNNADEVLIRFFDSNGKLLQSTNKKLPKGNHPATLDTSSLPEGIYYCHVLSNENGNISLKFVVKN